MVKIIDKKTTYIGENVEFEGVDIVIYPNVHIDGKCKIYAGTTIYPNTIIKDSTIESDCEIGPNAFIRDNSVICVGSKIGFSVEIKNSYIGQFCNIKHLAYVGDTKTGRCVNIGANCVVANYDGNDKHETFIDSYSFIGSGSVLVAPIKIGYKSFIAAGSTVTKDIDNKTFGIERSELKIKENKFRFKDSSYEQMSEYFIMVREKIKEMEENGTLKKENNKITN